MASRLDERMAEIAAQRKQAYADQVDSDNYELSGHSWMRFIAWIFLVVGIVLLVTPLMPLGILFTVACALILKGTNDAVEPTETAMYEAVRGEGVNLFTVGCLLWTALVGTAVVVASVGIGNILAKLSEGHP